MSEIKIEKVHPSFGTCNFSRKKINFHLCHKYIDKVRAWCKSHVNGMLNMLTWDLILSSDVKTLQGQIQDLN